MTEFRTFSRALLCGAAFVTPVLLAAPAFAEADQPAAAPAAGPAQTGIADIVVTAQRRAESSQRAAIAIDVLKPDQITRVTAIDQLTTLAPSVQFGNAGGSTPLFFIRGVGTFSANPYTDSAVAVNYDGVYLGRTTSTSGLFYDLDRIEILKGPQGTLYGRNATGGALNIQPALPKIGVNELSGNFSAGNYGAVNAQVAVNIPVSEHAALRVAGEAYHHDAYNTDGTFTEEGGAIRAQLLVKPSDDLSIRLSGDYSHLGGTGVTGSLLAFTNPQTQAVVPYNLPINAGVYGPAATAALNSTFDATAGRTNGGLQPFPYNNSDFYGLSLNTSANVGFAKLDVIASWRKSILDNLTAAGSFTTGSNERDEQYSLEARLSNKIGPVDWLVGAYMFRETVNATYVINNNTLGAVQSLDAHNNSYAGFGRLTWHVTDRFRLTGAARFTKDDKTFSGLASAVTEICTSPTHLCLNSPNLPANIANIPAAMASIGFIQPPGAPVYVSTNPAVNSIYSASLTPVNASVSPSKVTYRAGIEFDPRPGSLLYASVETGFRAGGFSFSSISPTYQPETITAYTIGSKNRFLNNRVQFNVEGFYWKYKNQQVPHEAFGATGGLEFVTDNIGASTNKGIEADLIVKPLHNTTLHGDVQYLDARNGSFVYPSVDVSSLAGLPGGSIPPTTSCPYTYVAAKSQYSVNCSGLRALHSPVWTINLGAQQDFDLPNDLTLSLQANTHYQASNIIMFERIAYSVQGAYWLSDASITLTGPARAWSIGAYISNIENTRYLNNTYINGISGIYTGIYNAPRTFGAKASFKF